MIDIAYTYISESNHQRLLAEYLPYFPLEFREKIGRYRRWQDAQLSLLGRVILMKRMDDLGLVTSANLAATKFGKPFFENEKIKFNISHSGEIVVCALGQHQDLGIDIEQMKPVNIEDFKYSMTTNEWARVAQAKDRMTAFYTYWTEKEAVIKAHGMGLSLPLKSFEVLQGKTTIAGDDFYIKEINLGQNYKCFIASIEPIKNIKKTQLNFSAHESSI